MSRRPEERGNGYVQSRSSVLRCPHSLTHWPTIQVRAHTAGRSSLQWLEYWMIKTSVSCLSENGIHKRWKLRFPVAYRKNGPSKSHEFAVPLLGTAVWTNQPPPTNCKQLRRPSLGPSKVITRHCEPWQKTRQGLQTVPFKLLATWCQCECSCALSSIVLRCCLLVQWIDACAHYATNMQPWNGIHAFVNDLKSWCALSARRSHPTAFLRSLDAWSPVSTAIAMCVFIPKAPHFQIQTSHRIHLRMMLWRQLSEVRARPRTLQSLQWTKSQTCPALRGHIEYVHISRRHLNG